MTGFRKDEVVHLWIAEGFIHQPKGMKKVEDLGSEYFHELLSQSFFQQSSVSKSCYMTHDVINDLAQYVDEELYFRLEDKVNSNEQYNVFERARHSSFIRQKYDVLRKFEPFYKTKCLRTFLSFTCLCARSGKMPLPIGKLINLKKLSKFIVAKGNGPRITELKGLSHLQGQHSLFDLQNVAEIRDVRVANLKEKRGLDALVLKWSSAPNDIRNSR
ncbi:putative disease resistance protein At3g14460 [Gossypium hirsutum]|uniref:Disease resistance protein At3g14460 n=1 Tax=Gossypium hirsutum TaxID=3635 RepID=A0A1U8LPZ6_GOSHI|nr:putative disease resistance protein At3g14460 [Gossypium hirsutum]